MARFIGPVCKLCRREGEKLFLKGTRCLSPKCSFERRNYAPGVHGRTGRFRRGRRSRSTEYLTQLREKQKARRIYGLMERQFRRYFRIAQKSKGLTGVTLLVMLESRMDNVVFRLGLATSRAQARQLVQHGHIDVNGIRSNTPARILNPSDVIAVRARSQKLTYFKEIAGGLADASVPRWLSMDPTQMSGRILDLPQREDIDNSINENLIVEYYSR